MSSLTDSWESSALLYRTELGDRLLPREPQTEILGAPRRVVWHGLWGCGLSVHAPCSGAAICRAAGTDAADLPSRGICLALVWRGPANCSVRAALLAMSKFDDYLGITSGCP